MPAFVRIAKLKSYKQNRKGFLASVEADPFFVSNEVLRKGLTLHFVPPVLDAPRHAVVSSCEPESSGVFISFDLPSEFKDKDALCGCWVIANSKDIPKFTSSTPDFLEGYLVIDNQKGRVGCISSVEEYPMQVMLIITTEAGTTALLPYVEDFIESVEEDNKSIYVNVPPGLWELNAREN